MTKTTTAQTATKSYSPCFCGCGFLAGGESLYKQGHDAKHVSVLLSYVAAGTHTVDEAKAALPSTALQVKLHNALARRAIKAEKAAGRKPRTAKKASQVKVGRWWYPVVSVAVGTNEVYVAYTAKDGTVKETVTTEDKLR